MTEYTSHYSVLLKECLEACTQSSIGQNNLNFADMTFGGGGHSLAIARQFPDSKVYSVDQDQDAIDNGLKVLQEHSLVERVFLNKMNFSEFPDWANRKEIQLNCIVMDLGVSSHHFDQFDRGFSFREDALLDMRMDQQNDELDTAADVLNSLREDEIADLIYKYGEETFSRRIAKSIVEFRAKEEIKTTKQLENIVFHCYPAKLRHKRVHPATKTFQALRIYVNKELEVLEQSIQAMFDLLKPNGILAIITFHSLEDRIVKHSFKQIFQSAQNTAKILTKKPIYPSEQELAENSRSRSAKLRLLQRI